MIFLISLRKPMNIKSEKGAVTLFVLVSCLFFLTSVACVNMYLSSKQSAVNKEYQQIKKNYENDLDNANTIYNNLKNRDSMVSFGTSSQNDETHQIIVPVTINTYNLDVKTIKYGWVPSPSLLTQQEISSHLSAIEDWTYVENENSGFSVQAVTSCNDEGFYYLCFMLDDTEYWNSGIQKTPDYWVKTASNNEDSQWFAYKNLNTNLDALVNSPSLMGNMQAIKYTGNVTTSKWANAMTTDGSMWVWIPRYAYKITSGYHTNGATGGTIEIKFLKNGTNEFLDGTNETVLTDPSQVTYTDNVQNEWLVHPAFTANANNGGGFGEISGFWFAKFEISGLTAVENDVITSAVFKSAPGVESLRRVSIGDFYKFARQQLYGETGTQDNADGFTYTSFGQSHIIKNSEWGAVAYLAQSAYGANGTGIEGNTSSYITGGNNDLALIYSTNAGQSTTKNAYGVYDMHGTSFEYVASYINNGNTYLTDNTSGVGMLTSSNVGTNSKYKTLYVLGSKDSRGSNYSANSAFKGDAIWETSNDSSNNNSWFSANSFFPKTSTPFFKKSNYYNSEFTGLFSFYSDNGESGSHSSSRLALVPFGT